MEPSVFEDPLLRSMKLIVPEASQEPMDLLSNAWCNSAIQVFQPAVDDCSIMFKDNPAVVFPTATRTPSPIQREDMSLQVDERDLKLNPHLKMDDLKSWIWLQQAIHPELDYDLYTRKKWFSGKFPSWNRSVKNWFKEMKQKRKEKERLQKAEVHAAISVAGVAAALAAVAAESIEGKPPNSLKENAVASAAALVAAQCAQVAQAVGANREQLSSAINAAVTATDANNVITLTAAAATSLRGAATLKGRPDDLKEKIKGSSPALLSNEFDFDYGRCRASIAKGCDILVATEDGQCRLRSVSAVLNRNAEVILRIKKKNVLTTFSSAKERIIHELRTNPDEPTQDEDGFYCIDMLTNQGKIKLKIDDCMRYKEWITTMNHMLMLSITFSRQELQFYGF